MRIPPEMREIVEILEIEEDIVLEVSRVKHERREEDIDKFGLIDGLILASERSLGEVLLTFDTNFRNLDDVILLKKLGITLR